MEIITRAQAKALGLDNYYTGKPCKHGHVAQRQVRKSMCKQCMMEYSRHHLYNTWYGMIRRCYREQCPMYPIYGARGIKVCDQWLDTETGFDRFLSDMGPRPEHFSLDRIDPDGDYCPENTRWADSVTQMRNKRYTKIKKEDLETVFSLLDAENTLRSIGDKFSCTEQNIWYIKKNRMLLEAGFYDAA